MSIRQQRILEGFVQKCAEYGITNEADLFEILKEAMPAEGVTGKKAANKNNESYYKDAGKLICSECGHKIERDAHGLPGDQDRTNVSEGPNYQL